LNLDVFFNAQSIAVIGASRERGKVGNVVFSNFLHGYKGRVYPVNPKATEIMGRKRVMGAMSVLSFSMHDRCD